VKFYTLSLPAYEPLSKQKAPKVLADALTWINTAITEFGIAGLTLRSLIDFFKLGLQNSNAAVRSSATKALVTVKLYAGSSVYCHCSLVVLLTHSL
jgi:cytoskeleton-associated protein 5